MLQVNDMNNLEVNTHVVFDIILAIFLFLGLLLNILVGNIYYRNEHIINHPAILIIVLTVANLLWSIGILPFSFSAAIGDLWLFQDPICGIVGFGNVFVPLGKLFTVCIMLAERGVAILLESKYQVIMKHYMFALYVFTAWFLAFLCAILPPALGFYSTVTPGKGTCFPPINTYAIIIFYIIYLLGGLAVILFMAKKGGEEEDNFPVGQPRLIEKSSVPPYSSPQTNTVSMETAGITTKEKQSMNAKITIDYERGKFEHTEPVSPSGSEGIFLKSPVLKALRRNSQLSDVDLVNYDLHTGKSKMSKEHNGVLVLFAMYAIVYLPIAITSIVPAPAGADNFAMILLYSSLWLDPFLLLLSRKMLRRAIDRMCFEVCCIELQCCTAK